MIEIRSQNVTEVFTAFGQKSVRAEEVALNALGQAQDYLDSGVPVGKHLADQLMLPLAIGAFLGSGGGVFRTMDLTPHSTTHLQIIRCCLGIEPRIESAGRDDCLVRFEKGVRNHCFQ